MTEGEINEIMKTMVTDGKILTYSNKLVSIFDPQPEQFDIEDIAQGLANSCRFGGQISSFYSIAQHSYYVSMDLRGTGKELWGLLHDASEAYIQDLITPLKYNIPLYREIEDKMMRAIATKFNLPEEFLFDLDNKESDIKRIDSKQLLWEWTNLKIGNTVKGWLPDEAKTKFLKRYRELQRKAQAVSTG